MRPRPQLSVLTSSSQDRIMQSAAELHRRLQKLIQTAQLALQQWHQAQVSFTSRLLLPIMFNVSMSSSLCLQESLTGALMQLASLCESAPVRSLT